METDKRPVILIVDDNRMNIDLMVDILKDQYQLQVALDGETALEIVDNSQPDLILLDIMMPGIDGYEVCKRLKSDKRSMNIPIIFVTAKAQVEDEAKGLTLGAVDYITKPASPPIVLARVQTQLSLYNQNRLLEEKVQQRTLELKKSKEKADQASRAKSAFLSNVSHELRTPLNHVMGLSTLLLEMDNDPERREIIKPIHDGAEQLTALINQLLDLTELESDAYELKYKPFDLRRMLNKQAVMFAGYARTRGIGFDVTIHEDVPQRIHGAPVMTSQALNNIIINAFQYTEKGHVDVDVRIDPEERAGLGKEQIMLRLTVTDSGVGIPKEKLDTIFDSFEIGEAVMTKRLCGSGIGLTISKHLIEKMGGKIWVESEVSKGSAFHIAIPFERLVND